MLYDVTQITTYRYGSAVPISRHACRLIPISRPGLRVIAASLDIAPAPRERRDGLDFFGNQITEILIETPHDDLILGMRARIEVTPPPLPTFEETPPWEDVIAAAAVVRDLSPDSPAHFLYPSARVPVSAAIAAYCRASFKPGRPIVAALADLTIRMHADFRYDPEATDVATPVDAAFGQRAGVCQDFAHIMICGLRSLGLPAAYVSGFLRTIPPPGRRRLEGADATHAWVSVWCGAEAGWIGFDPTNAVLAREDHIVLAVGRDYADVAPVIGVIRGIGDHTVAVQVDVVPVV